MFPGSRHKPVIGYKEPIGQEGFLRYQTPTYTVRLKVEEYRVKNGGCRIESEEWKM